MAINFNNIGTFNGIDGGAGVLAQPTSLQFGPDGRLYVSEQNGTINAFTMTIQDGEYVAVAHEVLVDGNNDEVVKNLQNHNDDGSLSGQSNRQVTGLVVTEDDEGNVVLYISSSDPRISSNGEVNLDTNSGVITKVTQNGTSWDTVDIIRGLPRSEENHATNGLDLSADGTKLYVMNGGNTNNGAPSGFFSFTAEYSLSGTLIEIDLAAIDALPVSTDATGGQGGTPRDFVYDLPTLDDPNIANNNDGTGEDANGLDENGPWGGNDGLNQAILPADAPLRIYADGFRNAYDVVITEDGDLYTVDNGSNGNLGGFPDTDANGEAINTPVNGGQGDPEPFFNITEGGYYGHANPIRSNQDQSWTVYNDSGNPDGAVGTNTVADLSALVPTGINIAPGFIIDPSRFAAAPGQNLDDLTPAEQAARLLESGTPVNRDGPDTNALATVGSSSNGITEYNSNGTAFGGVLDGLLLVTQFNDNITLLNPNSTNTGMDPIIDDEGNVLSASGVLQLGSAGIGGLGNPLDVTIGPDGTIWVAEIGSSEVSVFAPSDLILPDDPDFDNDGILNAVDPFTRDATNGGSVVIFPGQEYFWSFAASAGEDFPGPDGYGGGLTGVMINGETDFEQFFQEPSPLPDADVNLDNVKFNTAAGGGATVIEAVSNGDPFQGGNSGEYLFHTGATIAPTVETFTVKWSLFNPGEAITGNFQQLGGYIGTGDQSNYLKVVAIKTGANTAGIQVTLENDDTIGTNTYTIPANDIFDVLEADAKKIFFELTVDMEAETATPTVTYETADGSTTVTGDALSLANSNVLDVINGDFAVQGQQTGLALGLFATNNGEAPEDAFQAIFDDIEVTATGDTSAVVIYRVNAGGAEVAAIDGGIAWAADTTGANNANLADPGSNNASGFTVNPGATVAPSTPAAIFATERFDLDGGTEMSWAFDVSVPAIYEVRLFVGNGFAGTSAAGQRVFDVEIEGEVPLNLDNIDLSADFGHQTGAMISNFVQVTDGTINIDFLHGVENPLINAIEIIQLGSVDVDPTVSIISGDQTVSEDGGQVQISLATNVTVPIDETVTIAFEIVPGSATATEDYEYISESAVFNEETGVYTDSVTIAGSSSDATFLIDILQEGAPENDEVFTVNITGVSPNAQIGVGSSTVTIEDDDTIVLPGEVLFRINSGGAEVASTDAGPNWSADTGAAPTPFLVAGGENTFGANTAITVTPGNVNNAPAAIFDTERFDVETGDEMQYEFAGLADGDYTVNLYLVEGSSSQSAPGERSFDVAVEGNVPAVFDDITPFDTNGNNAFVLSHTATVTDGTLDLDFLHGDINNPAIRGIEIVAAGDASLIDLIDGVPVASGDFSTDPSAPDTIVLPEGGSTTIVSGLEGGHNDRDFITVTIPDGFRLVDVILDQYNADPGNSSFIGLVGGDNFVLDPAIPGAGISPDGVVDPGDLLGGYVFNQGDIGNDLLASLNDTTSGFAGFDEDALTGDLTFWLNQGGDASNATITFVTEAIPEPLGDVVVAINAGGLAVTQDGIEFAADAFFVNGTPFADGTSGNGEQAVFDGTIYETERFGGAPGATVPFGYSINVDPGSYTVELYFAEIFQPNGAGDGIGARVFDVFVEGVLVLDDFDILAQTGGDFNQPIVFDVPGEVSPDTFGAVDAIDIEFSASVDNAKISGIVVREGAPEPSGGAATLTINNGADGIETSNFGNGSFQITNVGNKDISFIELDVTDALLPDAVFDPFGLAGDDVGKIFTLNGGSDGGTGLVEPADIDGDQGGFDEDAIGIVYLGDGGIDGYERIRLEFTNFNPGESISFGVDMDPNSIAGSDKGILDSGAVLQGAGGNNLWDVGGIGGAELAGSLFTVGYSDDTTSTGQLQGQGTGQQIGAEALSSQDSENLSVNLTVNGLVEGAEGTYGDGGPQILIEGPAGETARVLVAKGFIVPFVNNFADTDPYKAQLDAQLQALEASGFPANNAVELLYVDIALDGTVQDISGLFDFTQVAAFDLSVPDQTNEFGVLDEAQLPLAIVASVIDVASDQSKGPVSSPIHLTFAENTAPTITPIADVVIDEAQEAAFTVSTADEDGDDVALSVTVIRDIDQTEVDASEYVFTDNGDGTASFSWLTDEADDGAYTATVTADDGSAQTTEDIALIVNEVADLQPGSVLYRVNVGGEEVAAADGSSEAWSVDTNTTPSEFRVSGSNGTPGTSAEITITDPSIPASAPEAVFQSERFDSATGAEMAWMFPILAGTEVTVNLLFAETFTGLDAANLDVDGDGTPAGNRVFDISVDEVIPSIFDDIDQFAISGGFNTGFALSFDTVSDGFLDLVFLHTGAENTTVKGIEILVGGAPDTDGPDATLGTAPDVTAVADTYQFTVVYSDDTAVDVSTLDSLDVTVSNGAITFEAAATLVAVDVPADGTPRTATYEITPPGGTWDETDNGSYDITLNDAEVADILGNTAEGASLGSFTVDVQPTDQVVGGSLDVAVTPGADLEASTFGQGSFILTNTSVAGVQVASVSFDLSSGILPDIVFDPTGAGGDATASPFTPNAGAAATGLVIPGDPSVDPFSVARNGGFDVLTMDFTDFDAGETFTFTTDIDPNSIQGVPGAGAAGAVSGYELIGSTVTVTFTDGTNTEVSLASLVHEGAATPAPNDGGSLGGSLAQVTTEDAIDAPTLTLVGGGGDQVASLPGTQSDVSAPDFTVEVTGPANGTVEILQMDSRLFIASGEPAFGVDAAELPFYANEAMAGQVVATVQLDATGVAQVPLSLLQTPGGTGPDGGVNHLIAVVTDGGIGLTSAPLVVKLGAPLVFNDPGVMTFDGSSASVIELPHDPAYEVAQGTIAFSFNAGDLNGQQGLFSKDASFFGGGGHATIYMLGTKLIARLQDDSSTAELSVNGLVAGQEYEIATTFGPNGVELWLDGNLVDSDALPITWEGNAEFIQWGGRGWASSTGSAGFDAPFNGTISDKQIYSEVLTASQIASLAASSSGQNTAPTAVADEIVVDEDGFITFDPAANDSDDDGDTVSVAAIAAQPANGTAVLNPDGTVTYTPAADFNGVDSFEVTVTDGIGGFTNSTVSVTVNPVNDDPTAVDDGDTTVLDTPVIIDVTGNDIDVDGDLLSAINVSNGANGTTEVNPDGTVTYTPNAGFLGDDQFTYDVTDGNDGSTTTATVTVSVLAAPNTPPEAVADAIMVDEDDSVTFAPGDNDIDDDGDTVIADLIAAQAANGTAVVNPDGTVTYTPDADFNGVDSFDVQVSDGNGGFDTETVSVTVKSINDQPTANDDSATTGQDDPVVINLLGNDVDTDGPAALSITALGTPANGTLTDNGNGTVTYTPNAGFAGDDTFSYTVTDGELTDTADVSVSVSAFPVPIFDMPGTMAFDGSAGNVEEIPHSDLFEIAEGTIAATFNAASTSGAKGIFTKDAAGFDGGGNHFVLYLTGSVLNARFQDGTNSVTLKVRDITADTDYDVAATFGAGGSKLYIDGALVASNALVMDWTDNVEFIQWGGRGWGSQSGQAGFDAPFNGTISDKQIYDVALTDAQVAELAGVGGGNSEPVAIDDVLNIDEDTSVTFDPTLNDSDVDGDTIALSSVAVQPANGTVTIELDGQLTYTPDADFNGVDEFDIVVSDGNGGTDSSTVTVNVAPIDDNPIAVDDAAETQVDAAIVIDVLGNDVDVDGDLLSLGLLADPANGSVLANPDGTITYTPDEGFVGTDSFDYEVSDGAGPTDTGTVTVDVSIEEPLPTPIFTQPGVETYSGASADVDNIAPDPLFQTLETTVAFSFIDDNPGSRQGLVTKDASFNGDGGHFAAYIDRGDLKVRFQDSSSSETFTFDNLVAGQEYEVATVIGDNFVELWVDGALIDSNDNFDASWSTNTEFLQIGGLGWGSSPGAGNFTNSLSGQIADLEIYDVALDADEIQTLAETSSFDTV